MDIKEMKEKIIESTEQLTAAQLEVVKTIIHSFNMLNALEAEKKAG